MKRLADRLGVDRKTVGRWLSGKTARISRDNAKALANRLESPVDSLTVADEADVAATRREQREAAELLKRRDLVQLLSPSDEWELVEKLIRSTMEPDLPAKVLGGIYNSLSTAVWRRGRCRDARRWAERAERIARRTGDRGMLFHAALNLSTIDSYTGKTEAAAERLSYCLKRPEHFEHRRARGSAAFNLGMIRADAAEFAKSLALQRESVRIFEKEGLDLNLAISWTGIGLNQAELGLFAEARKSFDNLERHAKRARFARGLVCAPIYKADLLSVRGRTKEAAPLIRAGLEGLKRFEVYDVGCHESAARHFRLAGDVRAARGQLRTGIVLSSSKCNI